MTTHISARLAWHNDGWNGRIYGYWPLVSNCANGRNGEVGITSRADGNSRCDQRHRRYTRYYHRHGIIRIFLANCQKPLSLSVYLASQNQPSASYLPQARNRVA